MPNTGVPTGGSRSKSHTGTEQWQSFEIRMRQRRAQRCLLRAEAALDAGLEAEARAALDEARRLRPETPSFDDLLATARVRRQAAEAEAEAETNRQRTVRVALAAAAGLVIVVGIGWAMFDSREATDVDRLVSSTGPVVTQTASGAQRPAVKELVPETAVPPKIAPAATTSPATVEPQASVPATTAAPAKTVPREPAPARSPANTRASAPAGVPAEPPPSKPPSTTVAALARPPVDASLSAGVPGTPAATAIELPALPPTPPAADPPVAKAPSRPAAAPTETISHEPAVRGVLKRFASAYSSLSASAAREVWPSVDARALSRAFDGLESQQVSLGDCRVTIDSSTARAECSGSATWTPKVGGGRRTEARQWEFDLARANGSWLIVQARAR